LDKTDNSNSPSPRIPRDYDAVLTGTTLRVYKFLIKHKEPISARELQRLLELSSPSVAQFQLEKLEKNGLISKGENGSFSVDSLYLKHFIRFQSYLVPKYLFYALLSTCFLVGWAAEFLFGPAALDFGSSASSALVFAYLYGLCSTAILTATYWYETIKTLRYEKI
jgi:DNA-binding transcriptional ArsR family regulator